MQKSAIKIVADLDKVSENVQSLQKDIRDDELTKEDKKALKNEIQDLIQQMEKLKEKVCK